jgi:hypothetical protein
VLSCPNIFSRADTKLKAQSGFQESLAVVMLGGFTKPLEHSIRVECSPVRFGRI